jgi:hypothetical protein
MTSVAYITPFFSANTVRFLESFTGLYDVRLTVISQEPISVLPLWQQSRIAISRQIPDVFNSQSLILVLSDIEKKYGRFHRFLGATEQLQVPIAEARQTLGVDGMDIETSLNFRDKSRMKKLFEEAGIPCARHALVTVLADAMVFAKKSHYPFVVKPVSGAGAQATYRVNNDLEMQTAFQSLGQRAGEGVVIEEFIQGEEYSLDAFSVNGKVVAQTINQYIPSPLEVMSNPWIQWRVILRKETTSPDFDDIRTAGQKALNTLGMKTGLSHMEWFRRNDGSIAISEVAARPPGAQFTTIISRACDVDILNTWVRLMVYDELKIPSIIYSSGAAYLRGQGSGKVTGVEGLNQIRSKYNDIITDIRIPRIGQEQSPSYEGEGYIILRHPDSDIVENALKEIVENVHVTLG